MKPTPQRAQRGIWVLLMALSFLLCQCECGELQIRRACKDDSDCNKSAPDIYCFEGYCGSQQCNPGRRDTCYEGPIETKNKGICREGIRTCSAEGLWSPCFGQILAQPEVCDRVDNDCNNKADDGLDCRCTPGSKQQCYNGPPTTFGKGVCKSGIQFCENDSKWGKCYEQELPSPELCDRLDNNCDGKVDNDIPCDCKPGSQRPCFPSATGCVRDAQGTYSCKGACKSGVQSCGEDNTWGRCRDAVLPQPEECNGKDDNCDGQIDELFGERGRPCTVLGQKGPCRQGRNVCVKGKVVCEQVIQAKDKELCGNGIDDNCDGIIDESPPCVCKPGDNQECYPHGSGCTRKPGEPFRCLGACQWGRMFCQSDQTWGPCLGANGPEPHELCNGKDDNCNGQTDEDFAKKGGQCSIGEGLCQQKGKWVCSNDGKELKCDATSGTPILEVCDGKDNDCDGKVDNDVSRPCFTGPGSASGRGLCRAGLQVCTAGTWGSCTGETLPTKELCDGLDNDCDGSVDEDFTQIGQSCKAGKGQCSRQGFYSCAADLKGLHCDAKAGQPTAEVCNSKDDDCDGQIDEDFASLGVACMRGVGSCESPGKWVCSADEKSLRCDATPKLPQVEICDNQDNDCDGTIDNDLTRPCYSGPAGSLNTGLCRAGSQTCSRGQWGTCVGEITPAQEICADGKDNNCDGQADEGCQCKANETRSCGSSTGSCQQGTQTCAQNGTWGQCVGGAKPKAETCDGTDEDCDGNVDNGVVRACYTGPHKTRNVGPCQEGSQRCVNGTWDTCVGEKLPSLDICDGIDNDCNGKIDQSYPDKGKSCTLGVGECAAKGTYLCATDGLSLVCQATPKPPSNEVCDGKDNDCDGTIDEALSQTCYSGPKDTANTGLCKAGTSTCANGQWGPCVGEIAPVQEVCNGKDDDCNGQTDEGCQCAVGQSRPCGSSTGTCQPGTQACEPNGKWGACVGGLNPSVEVCDNKDNDCDGQIDEDFPQKGLICYVGAGDCQQRGRLSCHTNQVSLRCDAVAGNPTAEVCDNKDNDCDGQIDEQLTRTCYTGPANTRAIGPCKDGSQSCSAGIWTGCIGEITPVYELCGDNRDNDCNGQVDDGCTCTVPLAVRACGTSIGECKKGTQTCSPQLQWGACLLDREPKTERCDGKDNDCDGQIDERWPQKGQPCSRGLGECKKTGTYVCQGPEQLRCDANPSSASTEVCDGKDNDCDGQIDEECP